MNKVKKQAVSSEINVVCEASVEAMARQIEALADTDTAVTVEFVDSDTAAFEMTYLRQGRATASVTGEIRRWADSMSHVICDGQAVQPRRWRPWRWAMVFIALLVSLPLFSLVTGNPLVILSALLMYTGFTLGTLCVAALYDLWRRMDWNRVPEERFARYQTGIPGVRDREALLHKIVSCVRQSEATTHLTTPDKASDAVMPPQEAMRREQR